MKSRFLFVIIVLFSLGQSYSQQEFQSLFNTKMKEGVACYRIPALAKATNGDLIAAIDERVPSCGDLRHSADINIAIRRSEDNGKTWSKIEVIVDFPLGESASDPSIIVDQITKEIFLFYNYMNLNLEKEVYYLHYVKSTDHGKTWSDPVDITQQISKPEWHKNFKFITSGEGIQTRSGKLLHTLVNLENGLVLFGSDDHGKTWHLIDHPLKPADESKVVELADGTWMVNSRVNGLGCRYVHTSEDEGKTWSSRPDSVLIDPSCNAAILNYPYKIEGEIKNILIFSNLVSKNNRENLSVRYSLDNGATWSDPKTIYAGSAAYSSLCILQNGDIGLFFEKDDYSDNVFTSFSLEWLLTE